MKPLTKREEQIMQIVWKLEKAFIREIVEAFPDPKPHYNTVATIVKILEREKNVLKSEKLGNMHRYSPMFSFEEYREKHLSDIKSKFFENSLPKMLAHFARKENLTEAEQEELIKIIKSEKSE